MDIKMSDIMLHIKEDLDANEMLSLENQMRDQTGVIALGYHDTRPHLMIVEYNRDTTSAQNLLHAVEDHGLHARLIGML